MIDMVLQDPEATLEIVYQCITSRKKAIINKKYIGKHSRIPMTKTKIYKTTIMTCYTTQWESSQNQTTLIPTLPHNMHFSARDYTSDYEHPDSGGKLSR